jgi:opacity protein-like surface antigen
VVGWQAGGFGEEDSVKRTSLVAAAALVSILFAAPSWAATGFGLGVHGGYGESKDADSGSPLAGVHMLVKVAPWLGLVGMADYKFEEDFSGGEDALTVTSIPLSAMARVYIPVGGFNPYLAAGVQYRLLNYGGDILDDDQYEIDDSDTSFGWLAGAGAEFNLSTSSVFFGEARYEALDPDQDFDNAIEDAENLEFDQWSARAGFTFFLK